MKNESLINRAEQRGTLELDNWVNIAFNEILGSIYFSEINDEQYDILIEMLANILIKKLKIDSSKLNWQKLEDWIFKEAYNLVSYGNYLNFEEAKEIIYKSKVSDKYNWEDIKSSDMKILEINTKMIKEFIEDIEAYGDDIDKIKDIYTN